jgi:hypothetical protein
MQVNKDLSFIIHLQVESHRRLGFLNSVLCIDNIIAIHQHRISPGAALAPKPICDGCALISA